MNIKLCNCGYFTPISGVMGPPQLTTGRVSILHEIHRYQPNWTQPTNRPNQPLLHMAMVIQNVELLVELADLSWLRGNLLPWSQGAQGERVFPIGKDRLRTTILQGRTVKPSGGLHFFQEKIRCVFWKDLWIVGYYQFFFLVGWLF